MMDQAALLEGSLYAAARIALGLWLAQSILSRIEHRRLALSWKISIAALALICSWRAVGAHTAELWWRSIWYLSSFAAATQVVLLLREWTTSSARLLHAELSQDTLPSPSEGRLSIDAAASRRPNPSFVVSFVAGLLSAAGCAAAAWQQAVLPSAPSSFAPLCAAVGAVSIAGLLGIVLVLALETTSGGTGNSLLGLPWRRIERLTLAVWTIVLALCGAVVALGKEPSEWQLQVGSILFCVGLLVVGYIAWSIPRRLAQLAAQSQLKGLASLSLAAWLAVLSLLIISWLPIAWPWLSP